MSKKERKRQRERDKEKEGEGEGEKERDNGSGMLKMNEAVTQLSSVFTIIPSTHAFQCKKTKI